jgi:zinc/manganese transport system ATP-binding protein
MRGRDLVRLGVDGHRFGFPVPRRGDRERRH